MSAPTTDLTPASRERIAAAINALNTALAQARISIERMAPLIKQLQASEDADA